VSRALDLATGRFVAIKRIDIKGTKADEVSQIMREVDLLQRLKHPGIVRYLGMARSDESLDIVLEFIEGGSLLASVKSFGPLNEELVAVYVGKILEGLHYLHSQDVSPLWQTFTFHDTDSFRRSCIAT
jgi:serine/threonine protein kinase